MRPAVSLPSWDLKDLYRNPDDPQIENDLTSIRRQAQRYEKAYRRRIASGQLSAKDFAKATKKIEHLQETGERVISYAHLLFATDTQNPQHGKLLTWIQEHLTESYKHLLFYEIELIQASDPTITTWLRSPFLSQYSRFMEKIRKAAPHRLSEPEERILEEKSNTGIRAFQRLFDETVSQMKCIVNKEGKEKSLSEQEALALLYHPSRPLRKAAAGGFTKGLKGHARTLTFIFNQVIADHASDDRLRRFITPISSRNLANEIDPEVVETLLATCESYYPIVARYYQLKKRCMGVKTLYDYDRYAPIDSRSTPISFESARDKILLAFSGFSEEFKKIAALFFEKGWIDAAPHHGKRGGAFSHGMVPDHHPYIFVNYFGGPRDVMTLAHELGHGVHQWLSRSQSYFNFNPPLTTSETASVFAEMLVFHQLKNEEKSRSRRLALLMEKIEDGFATLFRQVALCRFEQQAHAARRKEGELDANRISRIWMDINQSMFQGSVHLTDNYKEWWMYIGHFIHSPFYTYAYAFGHLLVMALYQKYLHEGVSFVTNYVSFLSAGDSQHPEKLLRNMMGIDIRQASFWKGGLAGLEAMVDEAVSLADTL